MDINNAFLQALLDEEVYITQPEGFADSTHPHHVCRLKKALYRLKQALLTWNHTLHQFLLNISFSSNNTNPCLYIHQHHNDTKYNPSLHTSFAHQTSAEHWLVISVYVNNILLIRQPYDIKWLKDQLIACFKLKDLGPISTILSIQVVHNHINRTINLSQPHKITDLTNKYGLSNCKLLSSPLPAGCNLAIVEHTLASC